MVFQAQRTVFAKCRDLEGAGCFQGRVDLCPKQSWGCWWFTVKGDETYRYWETKLKSSQMHSWEFRTSFCCRWEPLKVLWRLMECGPAHHNCKFTSRTHSLPMFTHLPTCRQTRVNFPLYVLWNQSGSSGSELVCGPWGSPPRKGACFPLSSSSGSPHSPQT